VFSRSPSTKYHASTKNGKNTFCSRKGNILFLLLLLSPSSFLIPPSSPSPLPSSFSFFLPLFYLPLLSPSSSSFTSLLLLISPSYSSFLILPPSSIFSSVLPILIPTFSSSLCLRLLYQFLIHSISSRPSSFSFFLPLVLPPPPFSFLLLFHPSSPPYFSFLLLLPHPSSFINLLLSSPHTYTHIFFLILPPPSLSVPIPFHFPVICLPVFTYLTLK